MCDSARHRACLLLGRRPLRRLEHLGRRPILGPVRVGSDELRLDQHRARLPEQVRLPPLLIPHAVPRRPSAREGRVHHTLEAHLTEVLHTLLLLAGPDLLSDGRLPLPRIPHRPLRRRHLRHEAQTSAWAVRTGAVRACGSVRHLSRLLLCLACLLLGRRPLRLLLISRLLRRPIPGPVRVGSDELRLDQHRTRQLEQFGPPRLLRPDAMPRRPAAREGCGHDALAPLRVCGARARKRHACGELARPCGADARARAWGHGHGGVGVGMGVGMGMGAWARTWACAHLWARAELPGSLGSLTVGFARRPRRRFLPPGSGLRLALKAARLQARQRLAQTGEASSDGLAYLVEGPAPSEQ